MINTCGVLPVKRDFGILILDGEYIQHITKYKKIKGNIVVLYEVNKKQDRQIILLSRLLRCSNENNGHVTMTLWTQLPIAKLI